MRALPLVLLLACSPGMEDTGPEGVVVRSWFDGTPNAAGGHLVVQVETPAELEVDLPEPTAQGLRFQEDGEGRVETVGDRVVVTRRWHFTGPEGSYEIPPLEVHWADEEGEVQSAWSVSLFADLGVEPPRPGEMADIVEPSRAWSIPWSWGLLCLGTSGAGLGGLVYLLRRATRRRRQPPPVVPERPDVVALRAWEIARKDPDLDDHDRAVAINRILRAYIQAVLAFPAESWTTSEILAHLDGLAHLPQGNVPRARRLLRATDRVKYADEDARADLFEDLDADLRAFVESTRSRTWEAS